MTEHSPASITVSVTAPGRVGASRLDAECAAAVEIAATTLKGEKAELQITLKS